MKSQTRLEARCQRGRLGHFWGESTPNQERALSNPRVKPSPALILPTRGPGIGTSHPCHVPRSAGTHPVRLPDAFGLVQGVGHDY